MWDTAKKTGFSGFGRSLLITAAIVVGVTALIGGWLASAGMLTVGGFPVTTFEGGFGAGIAKGLQFLFSGLGVATLIGGGLVGAFADIRSEHAKIGAMEAQRLAKEYERARAPELAPQVEKPAPQAAPDINSAPAAPEPSPSRFSGRPDIQATRRQEIRIPGSIIEKEGFKASELKRRVELAAADAVKGAIHG